MWSGTATGPDDAISTFARSGLDALVVQDCRFAALIAHLEQRHRLAPQVADYDGDEPHLRPYLGFALTLGRRGDVLNTDELGRRLACQGVGGINPDQANAYQRAFVAALL